MSELATRPTPPGEDMPRVQYGWYLKGSGGRFPLWAYTIRELDEAERERSDLQMLLWPQDAEIHARLRAKFARLRIELREKIVAHRIAARPPMATGRRPAHSEVIAMPSPAKVSAGFAHAQEQRAPSVAPPAARGDAIDVPVHFSGLGQEIRALLGEAERLGQCAVSNDRSEKTSFEPVAAHLAKPEPSSHDAKTAPPLLQQPTPDAAAVPPPFEPSPATAIAKSGTGRKFFSLWRKRAEHRSRRPCPSCGAQTHYVPNFSTAFSGLYLRVCKSCPFTESRHVKIQKLDDRDAGYARRRPYRRAAKRSRLARHLAIWAKKFRRCILD